jgi:predicted nucleic acid-binding protein
VAELGLLDTSVVVDLPSLEPRALPDEGAVSAVTLAELAASPHFAPTPTLRAIRQERLQRVEAVFEVVPFGVTAARAYAVLTSVLASRGQKPRGSRSFDILIAATARGAGLPLYTRNARDLAGLEELVEIIEV